MAREVTLAFPPEKETVLNNSQLPTSDRGNSGGKYSGASFEISTKECWICLQSEGVDMIAPCMCTGSMKYVHRGCLNRWRVDASNPRNFTHCRHCQFQYRLVLKRELTDSEEQLRSRRRRFLFKTFSNFFLVATSVQVGLILLAMLIRACDQKEHLVKMFGLPQVEHSPPAGVGDFWDAIRYHKTTYYLAAVLLAMACVGFLVPFLWCLRTCCGYTSRCDLGPCPASHPLDNYFMMRGCADCCECCADSCRMCELRECPDCSCGEAFNSCTHGCDCRNCLDCNGGDDCVGVIFAMIAVVVLAFAVVGLMVVFMATITWVQRVIARYFKLLELRQLTGEYEVQDLSEVNSVGAAPVQQKIVASAPPADPEAPPTDLAPSAPPSPSFAPCTDTPVQQSLAHDLQAVYGYRV